MAQQHHMINQRPQPSQSDTSRLRRFFDGLVGRVCDPFGDVEYIKQHDDLIRGLDRAARTLRGHAPHVVQRKRLTTNIYHDPSLSRSR